MSPIVACYYIILRFGLKILKEPRLINIASDYGLFREIEANKFILCNLIKDKFLYNFFVKLNKEAQSVCLYKFIKNTGFDTNLTSAVINIFRKAVSMYLSINKLKNLSVENDNCVEIIEDSGLLYSSNYKVLLGIKDIDHCDNNIDIKDGCLIIADNALVNSTASISIPQSILYISKNSLPINHVKINNNSPYFTFENGLFMTADKRSLYRCYSRENIVSIPKEVQYIDKDAFPTDEFMALGYNGYGFNPPYFLRIVNNQITKFHYRECNCIISSLSGKGHLKEIGIDAHNYIIGDVYIDSFGVIYTSDHKVLLCFPKELGLKKYIIDKNCEFIGDDAFTYYIEFQEYEEMYEDGNIIEPKLFPDIKGNALEVLVLPPKLQKIGSNSLLGLVNLKKIIITQYNKDKITNLLYKYLKDFNNFDYHKIKSVKIEFQ